MQNGSSTVVIMIGFTPSKKKADLICRVQQFLLGLIEPPKKKKAIFLVVITTKCNNSLESEPINTFPLAKDRCYCVRKN